MTLNCEVVNFLGALQQRYECHLYIRLSRRYTNYEWKLYYLGLRPFYSLSKHFNGFFEAISCIQYYTESSNVTYYRCYFFDSPFHVLSHLRHQNIWPILHVSNNMEVESDFKNDLLPVIKTCSKSHLSTKLLQHTRVVKQLLEVLYCLFIFYAFCYL